jgi:putative transposase
VQSANGNVGADLGALTKKSRFSDSQIMAILKQAENGVPVPELCREHGMSNASFYKWRAKFGGMDTSMIKRMKELEDENRRLKKMYAEERLKSELRKEALEGKW